MLFYWMIWIKLGWDDAQSFSVREIDLWILLGISLLCNPVLSVNLLIYSFITIILMILVLVGMMGSADRDVLLMMLLTQSFRSWLMILWFASCLALLYVFIKQKKAVPFLFFIGLGHIISFCLETL